MINIYVLGKKGLESLEQLDSKWYPYLNAIIIGKDQEVQEDYSEQVEAFAQKNQINSVLRTQVTPEIHNGVTLNIAIGWRWLLSLEIPLLVFHDSILPKYRGFNPLVSALINGDAEIGVTALHGTDEFDQGAIVAQRILPIQYPITIQKAIDLLAKEYAILLESVIQMHVGNKLTSTPQDETKATFSLWRDEEDYKIDWSQDSSSIKRMIDAVGFPYKGAYTVMEDSILRIHTAEVYPEVTIVNRTPGKVLFKHADGYVIVCGKGLLKVSTFYKEQNEIFTLSKFRIRFK